MSTCDFLLSIAPDLSFRYSIHGIHRRCIGAPSGLSLDLRKNSSPRSGGCEQARQTRVRFIPDDVHVVVIIIIAFCIITIISAATSVIYSRSRVYIMRAGVLRLRALITTLPVYSSVSTAKERADDRNRRRRRPPKPSPHVTRSGNCMQEVSPRIGMLSLS